MKSMNKFSAWIGAASLAMLAAACDNTARGVKQDTQDNQREAADATAEARERADRAADRAGDKVGEAADRAAGTAGRVGDRAADATRDAGNRVGDATTNIGRSTDAAIQTVDVKSALIADDRIDADDINVDTDAATKTVILKGRVPTAAQKTLAAEIAGKKAEGYRVKNELMVAR